MILKILVILLAAASVLFSILLFSAPAFLWRTLAGDPDLGAVDFQSLTKSDRPNQYLVCLEGICAQSQIDKIAKIYPVDGDTLKQALDEIARNQPRVEQVASDKNTSRFVARSAILQFPDTVSVEYFDQKDQSTLAIYARAQIGYSDFGANQQRVEKWLALLDKELAKPRSSE